MIDAGFTELTAYKVAEELADVVFKITIQFPIEERYSMTDQIRRSTRSVCSNLAEGYAKRCYPRHFRSKMTDALGELNETLTWLRFARKCQYIHNEQYLACFEKLKNVHRLLRYMISHPAKFGVHQY